VATTSENESKPAAPEDRRFEDSPRAATSTDVIDTAHAAARGGFLMRIARG
jgi:hypothetical protein